MKKPPRVKVRFSPPDHISPALVWANRTSLYAREARELAAQLIKAADEVEAMNRKEGWPEP